MIQRIRSFICWCAT